MSSQRISLAARLPAFLIAAASALPAASNAWHLPECASAAPAAAAAVIAVKRDDARARTWILGSDALYLYQPGAAPALRRFDLENWRYVSGAFACPPSMAIGPDGGVVVSSNIEPTLWRVDALGAPAVEIPLRLLDRANEDIGFTELEVSPPGIVWARGSADRSRWRIDLARQSAVLVSNDR